MTSIEGLGGFDVIFEHNNGSFSGFHQNDIEDARENRKFMMKTHGDVVTWWIISIDDNKVSESGGNQKDLHPQAFGYDPIEGVISLTKDKG